MSKLIRISLVSLFLFSVVSFCFAQEQNLITAIEIRGNKSISSNKVVSKMKSRIGGPYRENIISDDLKRLYLLGFFEDIKIDTEDYKDGVKLIVTVKERPVIAEITFSGFKRIAMRDEKLKDMLKSKVSQYLDYPDLAEDVHRIEKAYEEKGYTKVKVEYEVTLDEQANKAKVRFIVKENKKVRVKDVFIRGSRNFSSGRILKLMKTRRAWLFNPGIYKEDVLEEDIERIKAFYNNNGFSDAEAGYSIKSYSLKADWLFITVTINEGRRYLVGDVVIKGNKDIPTEKIQTALKDVVSGKIFSQDGLKSDIAAIQGFYFDRGYISARVQEAVSLNSSTGRVDVAYSITENEVGYVDKIKIRGNIKTRDIVIRRELRIYPGDKFDGEKLKRSRERLQNLGFFEEVGFDTEEEGSPAKKNLVVDVKESKTGAFSFGGGYSTVDDFVGFVEIEQNNFDWRNFPYFTGAGQNLKFRASFGTLSSGFDLSFTEPWMFDYPVSFGFDVYKRVHKRESDVGYGYDEKVTGGDLRLGRELSEYMRANLIYRLDRMDISDITEDATNDLRREYGENNISSLTSSLAYDSRDNVFSPRTGSFFSGSFEVAGGPLAGDKDFWKFSGRASHYLPMPLSSVVELRSRVGMSEPYDDSDFVPIYERFFAGGAHTIRGYEERKIGPIDSASRDPLGGQAMLIGNVEYTYPLLSFVKLAAFYDIGNCWSNLSDIGSGGFKSSVGLGMRIKSPIGPIMLDYGVPFNKEPGEDERKSGKFHFSASHGF